MYQSRAIATSASGARRGNQQQQRYPFPAIPRPQRNPFYYVNPVPTIKRGLSSLPRPSARPISFVARRTTAGIKRLPYRTVSQAIRGLRFQSSNTKSRNARQQRRFFRWWTVPAVTVALWAILRKKRQQEQDAEEAAEHHHKPAKPWQVAAYSTLPLKAMSRLWGKFNDITLPTWMREPGFKLYSYVFGVNLDEVAQQDLRQYANLGEFFYRELKPGVRPIDEQAPLVSPADGKVLHLGVICDHKVEQVKGVTYSLDALLGPSPHTTAPHHVVDFEHHDVDEEVVERHKNFAVMNGISYTLDDLIGSEEAESQYEDRGDASRDSFNPSTKKIAKVSQDVLHPDFTPDSEKELYFAVIYLAPGDYHRFHSPTNWVTELRRHFAGELYSVAPYFQRRLHGLFCLNERVALLGRWKYGFFSMTPVGATNVGSIKIHFDKYLQTNTVYENAAYASQSTESITSAASSESTDSGRPKRVTKTSCYEATYKKASRLLGGYPLTKGEQMGGFNLGSTVVLVFEAPKTFNFTVKAGDIVRVGQAMGELKQN
ncbi:phosphatidylserine decarboxylase proenzyme 1, mitochondrial [Trichomonascus vanleenenianus]|uniref:phosphatidylserine decarboxylase 1 n=1 Tax=Trichomonascus vanleenenianus TaxID=2268995 RepID=UPI003ECBA735